MNTSPMRIDTSSASHDVPERKIPHLLNIDPETFRTGFNRRPFTIRHQLANHPLFTLPELAALAQRLPAEAVRYHAGDIPVTQGLYGGPHNGLSVEETIRRIEECKSWMVLKWVERDPIYREVVNQCLDEIQQFSEPLAPGMCVREGFIFISSPSSLTPYHMDPEHNFLLQVRGSKTVHMWDPEDRMVLSEEELEQFFASSGDHNLSYRDEYASKASKIELSPGIGLQFPVTAPHYVQNGNEVSISFSVTFETPAAIRRSIVYDFNSRLRRRGISPLPYGRSSLRDFGKFQAYRVLSRARLLKSF